MKISIILFLFSAIILTSCKKETSTDPLNEMVNSDAVLLFTGNFTGNGSYNVSGKAEIFKVGNKTQVKLSNFSSSNGPDLQVFLSKQAAPINEINLGELKSTQGNQVYDLNSIPDFDEYKFISIHCVSFNSLFGSAKFN
jgi:hypothetical protein